MSSCETGPDRVEKGGNDKTGQRVSAQSLPALVLYIGPEAEAPPAWRLPIALRHPHSDPDI